MNVLVLSTWSPYPVVNGSTLRAFNLLSALARSHAVDLVAFSAPAAPDAPAQARLRGLCREVTVVPRSPFDAVPGARGGWFSTTPDSLGRTEDPEVRALVQARAARADIIIACQLSAARYCDAVPVPTVFEEAEPRQIEGQIAAATSLGRRARRSLTWWKHRRYLARLIGRMAAVTVVSADERALLEAIGVEPGKVHVVPNGADAADLVRARTVATPPRVIYPGSVTYAPNLDAVRWFLTHVMPTVRAARPEVEFWVTGDVGDVPVDLLPNSRLARFTGRLADVKAAVGDAAAAVVPLREGGGTRLKVLEALALGTPVVSTRKGVEGLEVVDNTHVLVADAPADFAAQVVRVLDDEMLAARLSAAGRRLIAASYTWDAVGRQLLAVVNQVGAGKGL